MAVTNWHHVCGNLSPAEAQFAAVAVKAECTHRNWAMWVMIIRECEVILCLEGKESALLGSPEESRHRIQGRYRTENETQLPHADCIEQTLSASVRTCIYSAEISHCLLEPTPLISSQQVPSHRAGVGDPSELLGHRSASGFQRKRPLSL